MFDPETAAAGFREWLREHLAAVGDPDDPREAARLLQMRVAISHHNRAHPWARWPEAHVLVEQQHYRNGPVMRHEVMHVLVAWYHLEANLVWEFGQQGWRYLENLVRQAELFLQMPQPMVGRILREHAVTARAVAELARVADVGQGAALRRIVWDDPAAQRAGFVLQGRYVADLALCNLGLPFWRGDHVPDVRALLPLPSASLLPRGRQTLGVVWT